MGATCAAAGYVAAAVPSQAADDSAREDGAFTPPSHGTQQLLWSVATDRPAVALTFDDGPTSAFTPRVVRLLEDADARATFFLIGSLAERRPGLVRQLLDAGHEVGNHTWSHQSAALLSAEQTRADIRRGAEALTTLTGQPPRWYRPPRGMLTGSALEHAHLLGQTVVMWTVDRGTGGDTDAAAVRANIAEQLLPGAIVNLHDGVGMAGLDPSTQWPARLVRRRETELVALRGILADGRARGLDFVTLSELVDER
jgi:peptidoglycan/xylan/chitin deacetylase (PgdA/CDA1 family)